METEEPKCQGELAEEFAERQYYALDDSLTGTQRVAVALSTMVIFFGWIKWIMDSNDRGLGYARSHVSWSFVLIPFLIYFLGMMGLNFFFMINLRSIVPQGRFVASVFGLIASFTTSILLDDPDYLFFPRLSCTVVCAAICVMVWWRTSCIKQMVLSGEVLSYAE